MAASWFMLYSLADQLVTLRAARNQDGRLELNGRLEVFGINSAGEIFHTWQTSPNTMSPTNSGWNGAWEILYGQPGDPQLVSLDVINNADGRLEVFGISSVGEIFHTWQTSPNASPNSGWNGAWEMLYSSTDRLVTLRAGRNQDGRLEIFGISFDRHIFHTWQTSPNAMSNTGWNGAWAFLYGPGDQLVSLDVINNADGRLEVFGINHAGNIFHTWQTSPNNGWNGAWAMLYGQPGDPQLVTLRAARDQDGRLEIFGINQAGNIFHTWQTSPNASPNDGWNGAWEPLYGPGDQLVMLVPSNDADGSLRVFGINSLGQVLQTWQTSPNGSWIGYWEVFSIPYDNIAGVTLDVANDASPQPLDDGRLEVFAINNAENIVHSWQTSPNNGWVIGPPLALPSLWADLTFADYVTPDDLGKLADYVQQNLLPTIAQRLFNMSVVQDVLAMNWLVVGPNVVTVASANMLRIGFWLVPSDFPSAGLIAPTTDFPLWQMTPEAAALSLALEPPQPIQPPVATLPASFPVFGCALSVPATTVQLIVDALLPSWQAKAKRHNATLDTVSIQSPDPPSSLGAYVSGSYLGAGFSGNVTETLGPKRRAGTQSDMPAVLASSVDNDLVEILSEIFETSGFADSVEQAINGFLQELPAWIPFRSSSLPAGSTGSINLQELFPFPMGVLNFDTFGTNDSGIIGIGSGSLAARIQSMVNVNLSGQAVFIDYPPGTDENFGVLLTAFEPDNDQMTWQVSDVVTFTVNIDPFSQQGAISTAFPVVLGDINEQHFTLSVNGTETCATDPSQTLEKSASLPIMVTLKARQT